MTRMGATGSPIATLADSADAILVARSAKNWLFVLLLLMLLAQLGTFFAFRFNSNLSNAVLWINTNSTLTATQPSANTLRLMHVVEYTTALIDFLGVVLAIVLAMDLLLLVNIMLASRIIGVGKVTSAYVWCLILVVLLFPWQAFLSTIDLKIPGILYNWNELIDPVGGATFSGAGIKLSVLHWARFVGWPLIAILLLMAVQAKGTRGVRLALGEAGAESAGAQDGFNG